MARRLRWRPAPWALLIVAGAHAGRLAAPDHLERGGAARRPSRAPWLLALAALPAAACGEELTTDVTMMDFDDVDKDRNGQISRVEFTVWSLNEDNPTRVKFETVFSQADIDDDQRLNQAEFRFSRYICHEEALAKARKDSARDLPMEFFETIDNVFWIFRSTYEEPGYEFQAILSGIIKMFFALGLEEMDTHAKQVFHEIFKDADIIPDGFLNLNELDYFQRVVRDIMMASALGDKETKKREVSRAVVDGFFKAFDKNADGRLTEAELEEGLLASSFGQQDGSTETVHDLETGRAKIKYMRKSFPEADANGDGFLDLGETNTLIRRITQRSAGELE